MDDWRVGVGGDESSEHMRQARSERWAWQCGDVLIHTCMMHGAKLSTCGLGVRRQKWSLYDGWCSHEYPTACGEQKPTYEWTAGSTGAKPQHRLTDGMICGEFDKCFFQLGAHATTQKMRHSYQKTYQVLKQGYSLKPWCIGQCKTVHRIHSACTVFAVCILATTKR